MSINKQGFTLIYQDGRGEVCAKELVTSYRGEKWVVEGGTPPHKPSSTGRVWVRLPDNSTWNEEFFPSVFGMEWREDDVHTTAS
tara:strand:+ start:3497 stop:3748 length:252 start_codon:yes stop_codon:yes gene_type:complete